MKNIIKILLIALPVGSAFASSHREAPLIANDPLADNTDLYAFKSPNDPNSITIIANYVPLQIPHGGPNYYSFGQDIRYEIHIDNDISTTGDDIVYRFTFLQENEDPTTFFNIRLGQQNLKMTYTMERSLDGGATFATVLTNEDVPPPNIGPRSIDNATLGLNSTYEDLMAASINTTVMNEKVFCGTSDDPFFADLGGIFDLGDAPRQNGGTPQDALKCLNVSSIALQIPVSVLQKDGLNVDDAANILDGNFVIGVWASASRKKTRTLNATGGGYVDTDQWVQVSRLGMPLTNEAVIPVGQKDFWNSLSPYQELAETTLDNNFYNPELALYMDDDQYGGAVPAFAALRIQKNSRPDVTGAAGFDFSNGNDGLYPLAGSAALNGTALDNAIFGTLLLPGPQKPRSVDLWPIFHTGVPNLRPYQLAEGKDGDPLAEGKPFINNFLPNGGDMLRLNMAVPATSRTSPNFSSMGLLDAMRQGLTNIAYSGTSIQSIPNMDGFPNGRRLEDDVTRIELQAVGGAVLAAIGLYYDDYVPPILGPAFEMPVTADFTSVLNYSTGVEENDLAFNTVFPYVQTPWRGTDNCLGRDISYTQPAILSPSTVGINELSTVEGQLILVFPNPFTDVITFDYTLTASSDVDIKLYTMGGQLVSSVMKPQAQKAGKHSQTFATAALDPGMYFAKVTVNSGGKTSSQLIKVLKTK